MGKTKINEIAEEIKSMILPNSKKSELDLIPLEIKEKMADIKMVEAFVKLEQEQLLYSEILKRINFVITNDFKMAIAGIGYNPDTKKIYCYFNLDAVVTNSKMDTKKDFSSGNVREFLNSTPSSINDLAGLTYHEAAHMLYDHIFYIHHDKDKTFGKAKDYVINDGGKFLSERYDEIKDPKNNSILNGGCFFREISDKIPEFKGKTANDFTSIEIYEILKKYPSQSNNSPSEGFDEHSKLKISEDEEGNVTISGELTEEEIQDLNNAVKEATKSAINDLKNKGLLNKAIGQLKGETLSKITEMMKSVTDKKAVYNFIHSLKNGRKASFKKVNKRYPYLAQGRASDKKPILVRGIDSSGSMDNPELRMMIADQVRQSLEICKQVHIVVGDTVLQFSKHIEDESDFSVDSIEFKGGGGTNLQFIWDYAESIDADGVVCDTDGFIGAFDDKGIPSMFYLYGKEHMEVEGYDNYRVYPED